MATDSRNLRIDTLIVGLALMRHLRPDLFRKALDGTLAFEEVRNFLQLDSSDERNISWSQNIWKYVTGETIDHEFLRSIESHLFRFNFSEPRNLLAYTARMMNSFAMSEDA